MRKYIIPGLVFLLWSILSASAQQTDDRRFNLSKHLEVFNSLVKELDLFYVDTIQPEKVIQDGINGMLAKLDPYTNYISEKEQSDFAFMTTGEYAGIGCIITNRSGRTYIAEPYEGMPADVAGLRAGDEVLEIDNIDIKEIAEPSEKMKGQPNTKVKIKYQRVGNKKPSIVEIVRKRIQLNPVTYYGVLDNNVGYIRLSGFTEQCAQEVKLAFDDLKKKQGITSIILDLRENPGGIMEEAVQITNIFVPKGEIIVSTKGKVRQWDRVYRTTLDAIDNNIPLAVLVGSTSASAAEIVSGAIQDLDRGVVVGERTFGKGLVQTSRELPYSNSLKVTTSKYYIPSGRCIQAIDYAHRNPDGSVGAIPDSLTSVFYTKKGRPVRDGGGVTPDIRVETERKANITYYLMLEHHIFDYATLWVQKHETIAGINEFAFTESDYEDFKNYIQAKEFKYDRQSERALASLQEIMAFEGYSESAEAELKALEAKLHPDLDRDLEINKKDIIELLSAEIIKRYYYQKGEIAWSLKTDACVQKAQEILCDSELYQQTLTLSGHLSELPSK